MTRMNLLTIAAIFTLTLGFAGQANAACTGDTNGDGSVDVSDLLTILAQWGPCDGECSGDLNGDGSVDVSDLLTILAGWGVCPPEPNCEDLAGTDWGGCAPSPLGAGVVDGVCITIFGCEVPEDIVLWANVAACEAACTGCTTNDECPADKYCHFEDYTCGDAGLGSCVSYGEVCSAIYDPICSCDYQIVSNACYATIFGVSIMSDGECAQEDVCTHNGGTWDGTECTCPVGFEYNYQRGCEAI